MGQFSSAFSEVNLSDNGLCHEASVGGRKEAEGRKVDGEGAKESKQEVMPA